MALTRSYGLAPETRQYLRRLYAYGRELNKADIVDIDNFVKGLKQLSLWQYVIDGWLLSSAHNIGTGSLVASLVGKYVGTSINSPTWGNQGITLTSNGQYIDIGRGKNFFGAAGIREFSHVSVLNTPISSSNSNIFGIETYVSINPTTGVIHAIYGPTGNRVIRQSGLTGGNLQRSWGDTNTPNVGIGFYYSSGGQDNIIDPVSSNGYTEHNTLRSIGKAGTGILPRTFVDNQFWIFGSSALSRMEVAFLQIWFKKMLNTTQTSNLRALIKTTIGKGIPLP